MEHHVREIIQENGGIEHCTKRSIRERIECIYAPQFLSSLPPDYLDVAIDKAVSLSAPAAVGKKRKAAPKNSFNKEQALSPDLASLLGVAQASRPQVVKLLWRYIKEHRLQNPKDSRYIDCDEKMKSVFKTAKVHMFTMNKLLSKHFIETLAP